MYNTKMMIIMRRDLKMRKGKIAAQAGHAAVEATIRALKKEERLNDIVTDGDELFLNTEGTHSSPLCEWMNGGCAKICVYVDSQEELDAIAVKAEKMGIISVIITDAGATEFHGVKTKTCLALEPLPSDIADSITGALPLY